MPRKRKTSVTDDQIVAAYLADRSTHRVAEALGIGGTTVTRVLQKRGIPRTGLSEFRGSPVEMKRAKYQVGRYDGSTDQILRWYAAGDSMQTIARRIGRSVHVVLRRVRKAGIARPWQAGGPLHSSWIGGRLRDVHGYWKVWIADDDPMVAMRTHQGYVLEHRLVMARKLGRPLRPTETVHHIDGDKSNNAPENLQLRQGRHGKHVVMICRACGSHDIGHAKLG